MATKTKEKAKTKEKVGKGLGTVAMLGLAGLGIYYFMKKKGEPEAVIPLPTYPPAPEVLAPPSVPSVTPEEYGSSAAVSESYAALEQAQGALVETQALEKLQEMTQQESALAVAEAAAIVQPVVITTEPFMPSPGVGNAQITVSQAAAQAAAKLATKAAKEAKDEATRLKKENAAKAAQAQADAAAAAAAEVEKQRKATADAADKAEAEAQAKRQITIDAWKKSLSIAEAAMARAKTAAQAALALYQLAKDKVVAAQKLVEKYKLGMANTNTVLQKTTIDTVRAALLSQFRNYQINYNDALVKRKDAQNAAGRVRSDVGDAISAANDTIEAVLRLTSDVFILQYATAIADRADANARATREVITNLMKQISAVDVSVGYLTYYTYQL